MIEFIYPVFFWILVLEVFIFCFLNLPSPKGWKGAVVRFINTNYYVQKFLKLHIWLCIGALFFFYDCYTRQQTYQRQRMKLKNSSLGELAQQFRKGFLSYNILKVQRNQYITAMLIYASIILNIYLNILHYIYEKRQKYEAQLKQKQQQQHPQPVKVEQKF